MEAVCYLINQRSIKLLGVKIFIRDIIHSIFFFTFIYLNEIKSK